MTVLLAIAAGALIGLSLGALGGGGSILAVPVLVYLLVEPLSRRPTSLTLWSRRPPSLCTSPKAA